MNTVENLPTSDPLLDEALAYAANGWHVIPIHSISEQRCTCDDSACGSPGKHPVTRQGLLDATTDEAIIRRWWSETPNSNIAICTGPESRLWMFGPDGDAGIEALTGLEKKHGALPRTIKAKSGGGGEHYFFSWPADGNIRNSRNIAGLPIDVRGAKGYAIVAPSQHHSGGCYRWEIGPNDASPAEAPEWLIDFVGRHQSSTQPTSLSRINHCGKPKLIVCSETIVEDRARAYLANTPPAISGQGGHDQTFKAACVLILGFALSPDQAYPLLVEWNERCQPPWTEKELLHKLDDANKKEGNRGNLLNRNGDKLDTLFVTSFNSSTPKVENVEGIESVLIPEPPPWPVLSEEALDGLAGDIVQTIEPETEADPAAILLQTLVGFGNVIGRGRYYVVENDFHHANLFTCLVGESSRGRKGTSRGRVMSLFSQADEAWCKDCVASGMSSGEGLIWAVRDPIEVSEPIRGKGKVITGYQTLIKDHGIDDKRLLVAESEFAQCFKVMSREGNILSAVIRQAWESGNLRVLAKNVPTKATGAHISVAAHITRSELTRYLSETDMLNGFANRFLWCCVRRSKLLPDGGQDLDLSVLADRLAQAVTTARQDGRMCRSAAAHQLWHDVYPDLTAERPGLYGAVTGRAEAQTLRLSMIYALLDGSNTIQDRHLRAALAVWSYCQESARIVFGGDSESNDPLATVILTKIRESSDGLTRTDIYNLTNRNIPAKTLVSSLAKLRDQGLIHCQTVPTKGRPAEKWFFTTGPTKKRSNEESLSNGDLNSFSSSGPGPHGDREVFQL